MILKMGSCALTHYILCGEDLSLFLQITLLNHHQIMKYLFDIVSNRIYQTFIKISRQQ